MYKYQRLQASQGLEFGAFFQYIGLFVSKLKLDSSVIRLTGKFAIAMGLIMFAWGGWKYFKFRAAAKLPPGNGESGGSASPGNRLSSSPWWRAILLLLAWIALLEGSMILGEHLYISALLVGFVVVLVFEIAIISWAGHGDDKPTPVP